MDDCLDPLSGEERAIFSTIAQYAYGLGYKAKKDKTSALGYSFTHSKVKKGILRFTSSRGKPVLRIKFFAAQEYSQFFHEAIRATIEEYDYKYTGCYGCANQCGGTEGYRYRYPDGREYYRCGSELIEIDDIKNLPLVETLDLLKKQHEHFLSRLQVI